PSDIAHQSSPKLRFLHIPLLFHRARQQASAVAITRSSPYHLPHPRHHIRIRRPQRHPLQKPQPESPFPPPLISSPVQVKKNLRPLQHRQSGIIPDLSQIKPTKNHNRSPIELLIGAG